MNKKYRKQNLILHSEQSNIEYEINSSEIQKEEPWYIITQNIIKYYIWGSSYQHLTVKLFTLIYSKMQNAIIIHAIITILHNTCVPELWKAVAQPEENHGESGSQNGSRKITSAD